MAMATYNEEKNLPRTLNSIKNWVNEIVIVDGQSSDKTVAIAKKYKARIIKKPNRAMFHINKQIAIDNCRSDWILQLDADEVVSPQLAAEIQQILKKNPKDIPQNGFWINRRNFFLAKFLTKGGQYPDAVARLYKKGQGRLPCQSVHEKTQIIPPIGQLKNHLLHYADPTLNRYLDRNNRYTSLMAEEMQKQKIPLNLFTFINYFFIKPSTTFIKIYFRHLGLLDGLPGLIFAYYSAISHRAAYIKYKYHGRKNYHLESGNL